MTEAKTLWVRSVYCTGTVPLGEELLAGLFPLPGRAAGQQHGGAPVDQSPRRLQTQAAVGSCDQGQTA